MTFYDFRGRPTAYLVDEEYIYLFDGRPVAYLVDNKVYAFNGHFLGWYENGWIRDKVGKCVFFTEDATGSGPAKPAKYAKPAKGAKRVKPVKNVRQSATARPVSNLSWSGVSGESFFQQ